MPRPRAPYAVETITISTTAASEIRAEAGRRKVPVHAVAHEWIMQIVAQNAAKK